jgi:hypothetical protein
VIAAVAATRELPQLSLLDALELTMFAVAPVFARRGQALPWPTAHRARVRIKDSPSIALSHGARP